MLPVAQNHMLTISKPLKTRRKVSTSKASHKFMASSNIIITTHQPTTTAVKSILNLHSGRLPPLNPLTARSNHQQKAKKQPYLATKSTVKKRKLLSNCSQAKAARTKSSTLGMLLLHSRSRLRRRHQHRRRTQRSL